MRERGLPEARRRQRGMRQGEGRRSGEGWRTAASPRPLRLAVWAALSGRAAGCRRPLRPPRRPCRKSASSGSRGCPFSVLRKPSTSWPSPQQRGVGGRQQQEQERSKGGGEGGGEGRHRTPRQRERPREGREQLGEEGLQWSSARHALLPPARGHRRGQSRALTSAGQRVTAAHDTGELHRRHDTGDLDEEAEGKARGASSRGEDERVVVDSCAALAVRSVGWWTDRGGCAADSSRLSRYCRLVTTHSKADSPRSRSTWRTQCALTENDASLRTCKHFTSSPPTLKTSARGTAWCMLCSLLSRTGQRTSAGSAGAPGCVGICVR